MKINISRESIYILSLSILLLIFVFLFSFLVLIPEGKEYRIKRSTLNKQKNELRRYKEFNDETLERLKNLQSKNGRIITAFETSFNSKRFQKIRILQKRTGRNHILCKVSSPTWRALYEVNTTSSISSPQNFYDFLDAINKDDWIISVNFPINFKRDAESIRSSFTMKVYGIKEKSKKKKSAK